ncbi:hypothetical protein OCO53_13450 [Peribacillus frigoritolerans]|uniref:hypothetical protein n=1 Tax=Peribacillus frigoritolerans TaxID=450367 RepID=UPI0021D197B9|nr:hypothetical protein [Peribacillus frigoritolerans]MCU6601474.1 hypothetical protein [Peribacillus frigoritolerans]
MLKIGEQTKFRNLWSGCFEQVARSLRKVPSIQLKSGTSAELPSRSIKVVKVEGAYEHT